MHIVDGALGNATTAGGSVIVIVAVLVHPFESVIVTIYVPAHRPLAVAVVCAGVVFHENK